MLQRKAWVAGVLMVVALGALGMRRLADEPGAEMTRHAQQYLAALDSAQRTKSTMGFDDPARLKWHFIPMAERKGLQVKEMTDPQRLAALALLRSALSQLGYDKATQIMALEGILRELERTRKGGPIRDPHRYYFTIFGQPQDKGSWGLSVEGHHLSLNFVVQDGKLQAYTPAFFGANPGIVRNDISGYPKPGTRTLAAEEQFAFDLLGSLTAEQRKVALIAEKAPADIRGPADQQPPRAAPEGLVSKQLNDAQKKTLLGLLDAYLANLPERVASQRLAEIRASDADAIYFAWAGADKPGVGHYYRVQGTTFLVEFVNVQPDGAGNPANHIHAVWRDLRGDFGVKL